MQKKELIVTKVEWVEGVPADFFILHGHSDTTRVEFQVQPNLIVELAELYKSVGHAGHAIWHRNNEAPIPCSMCSIKA